MDKIYAMPYTQKIRNGCYKAAIDVIVGTQPGEVFLSDVDFTFQDVAYERALTSAQAIGQKAARRKGLEWGGVILLDSKPGTLQFAQDDEDTLRTPCHLCGQLPDDCDCVFEIVDEEGE